MQQEINSNDEPRVGAEEEEIKTGEVPEQLEIENVAQEVKNNAKGILESVLFASGEPVSLSQLHDVLKEGFSQKETRELLNQMKEEYLHSNRGFELVE
ncbi:MAG: SMC-Scp complex subunit ScpB, partial [Candidatus Aureabacteria bacterium]|nr:SMC-Scp complex subunit ScpB [Candidatus Auribacterota bacterium]